MSHRKILISGKRPLDRSEFKQIHVICRKIYEPLRSCPSCLQAESSSFVVWEKARQEWMEGCRHAGGQWTSGGGPRKILTSFSASIYLLSRFIGSRYTWGPICWTGCQYKIWMRQDCLMLTHSKTKIYWGLMALVSIKLRRDIGGLLQPFLVLSHLVSCLLSQDVDGEYREREVSCGCFLWVWEMIRGLIVLFSSYSPTCATLTQELTVWVSQLETRCGQSDPLKKNYPNLF